MTVDLDGPKAGEVLVEIKASGVCHTDEFTRSGADPEGLFPAPSWAMKAPASSSTWDPASRRCARGDHVIPLYTPECRQCKSCTSHKTNLCTANSRHPGQGVDAGRHQPVFLRQGRHLPLHGMLHVLELHRSCLKSRWRNPRGRPFRQGVLHRLRRDHRDRSGDPYRQVEAGANVVVFGLGGIGLNVVQGARMVGANKNHRRGFESGPQGVGREIRPDPLRQSQGSGRRSRRAPGRADRRRRRLQLRMRRQM